MARLFFLSFFLSISLHTHTQMYPYLDLAITLFSNGVVRVCDG